MATITLDPASVTALIDIANNSISTQKASIHPTTTLGAGTSITGLFCADYQQGKAFLQSFAWLLNLWPGGGAIGVIVLNALFAVGDALYAQGCSTTNPPASS